MADLKKIQQKIKRRNLMATWLIATFVSISFLILLLMSHQQDESAEVLNVAGSQRMLSQKIAFLAIQHYENIKENKIDVPLIADLKNVVKRFNDNQEVLKTLSIKQSEIVPNEVHELYFDSPTLLNEQVDLYSKQALLISNSKSVSEAEHIIHQYFNNAHTNQLLNSLDLVVTKIELHTHQRHNSLKLVETGLWLAIMVLLVIISIYIFRPLQTLLTKSHQQVSLSKKKRAELALALNQHAIVYRINMDEKGSFTEVNKRFLDFYGYTEAEILGESVFNICGSIYTEQAFKEIFREIVDKEYWHGESINKIKGGRELWLSTTIIPVNNEEQRIESFVVVQNDISDIKQTELTLNQLHEITSDVNKNLNEKINDILILGKEIFDLPLALVSEIKDQEYKVAYCHTPNGEITSDDIFELGNTYCCHTLAADKAIAFHHAGESSIKGHPCYLAFGLESYIGSPIIVEGERFGTLNFSGPEVSSRKFTERELDIIQLFAHWISAQFTRVRQQEKLIGQQSLMEQMAQQARIGAWEVDLVSNEIYWSSMTKEIHEVPNDYKPELSQAINFYKEGESRDKITQLVEQSIKFGTPYEHELQLITAKGNEVWVSARGRSEFVNGECVRLFGSFQDISDKMSTQQKISQHNQRISLATDSSGIGIWELNLVNNKLKWDEWMFKLHGVSNEKFNVDYPAWQSLVHPEDVDRVCDELMVAINCQDKFNSQYRIIWPNGGVKHIKASAIISQDNNNQPVAMVGVNYDITESVENSTALKLAKEQAEIASIAKNEFFASMSHEIRTPMNGVIGMLDLVKDSPLNEEQEHRVNIAQQSAKSLLTLINDILDFSKIDANKLELENVNFNLPEMVGELAESLAPQAQNKGVELILDLIELEESFVIGDANRIRQIYTNLLSNAIKFTRKGEVTIKVEQIEHSDTHWRIKTTVIDTGIGIPKAVQENLFEVFTQVDASTTREYGGTGLGLAIVKKLCLCMEGNVSVESIEGEGSQFTCNILLEKSPNSLLTKPKATLTSKRVLIIENNIACSKVIQQQLNRWDVIADVCHDEEKASSLINNEAGTMHYELILINQDLPGDVSSLVNNIKVSALNKDSKVILMTLMKSQGNTQNKLNERINSFFPKPVTINDLHRSLNILLDEDQKFIKPKTVPEKNKINSPEMDWTRDVNLLLVEDNRVNQMVAKGVLNKIGIAQCDIAVNGKEALEKLKASNKDNPYTFIFMDCQMPEMDGYEATRLIRQGMAGERYQDIAIVAMTANAMRGDEEKCLSAGMNDYLVKPIDQNRVRETIKLFQASVVL